MKTNFQQAPIRNANTIGASVYSHSGEFAPVFSDLELTGRGLNLQFIRSYRSSLADHIGELGRGWSASIAKRIVREGDDLIYHNGAGEVYKFLQERKGAYASAVGFYGILMEQKKQFILQQRYGRTLRFEVPERGGRIVSIGDRNQNAIQFSYSAKSIVIIDTLKRKVNVLVKKALMQELRDHAGRTWKYTYDKDSCLIEVTQPTTADFPNGTSIKYAYDTNHRLISVTDAKGQQYLVNHYDESGKVIAQEHGSGVFRMEYEATGEDENEFPTYRTICLRKNGSKLALEHSSIGNVLSRTLNVRKESFVEEDRAGISGDDVPVVTNSAYNKNSELTSFLFPAGNKTEWVYSEDEESPLNRGNLLQITETAQADVETDQTKLVTKSEYEEKFQLLAKHIDPKGNEMSYEYDDNGNLAVTTYPSVTIQPVNSEIPRPAQVNRIQRDEYQYNSMGQLVQRKHIDGSVTEYYYYPADDPIGRHGLNTATNNPKKVCGYLARVVRDANRKKIKTEYAYNDFGNATKVFDGKSNPALLRYNAMGKVESVIGRRPFKHRINCKYDANYNEIESAQSFDRLEYDETNQTTTVRSSTLRELTEYDALDNVTLRKIIGDDKVITEHFIRDADERIIRHIQPLGNATEYVYDERNLLITKQFGVGTRETSSNRYAYTLNGAVRTSTDGNSQSTTYHYDGFHRYKGFTNPVGTKKTQWFDASDNVVRVEIDGDKSVVERGTGVSDPINGPLMEANYHFDQWNRAYRVDEAWHSYTNDHNLGESKWNGEKGIISTVVEYAENGLPGKVWTETGNVVGFKYDGVGQLVKMKDLTGEEVSFEYDENNNPILVKQLGPEVPGRRFERELRSRYDEMDRLIWQQENNEAPERFAYNALGNVVNYISKSGIEINHTDDALGRRVGHAFTITDGLDTTRIQKITRGFEYDDNYRLSGYTDAAGKRTAYRYDMLDRQVGVDFPDGNAANVEYDANGNIVRLIDQNSNEITNRYDDSNRLVARQSHIKKDDKTTVEQYEYDGLGRMVAAIAPDGVIRRTYDSLSRLLTEQQGDHVLRYAHDSAGDVTSLIYPGGEEVHKAYDIRNRLTSVANKARETLASFVYHANDQIAQMLLGEVIVTDFSYNQQERLESIEYRRTDDHRLLEGFRYQYDDSGRMTNEIELIVGPTYGERYNYDDANRATRVQYGVQDVFDKNSSFEQQTSYEHFAEGSWKRRIDVDGPGHTIDDRTGSINQLNNYEHFGDLPFAYDANGNCIRKGKSNPGHCDYTYDQYNRLIKSECCDAQGNKIQAIAYFYDALGRQVRKVVTDESGNIMDYGYVWAGNILIEEYENGVLVRSYFYGCDSIPVQLSVNEGGRSNNYYYYTHNGKGLVSGLVHRLDPNEFAEKYAYELTGASFMKEINGVKIGIPSRQSTISGKLNSVLSGNGLKDWPNKTHSHIGGTHTDSNIAAVLNSVNKGTGGVMGAFNKQLHNSLNIIGRGSRGQGPTGAGTKSGLPPGVQLGPSANYLSMVSNIGSDYVSIAVGEGPKDYVTAPASDAPTADEPKDYVTAPASDAPTVDLPTADPKSRLTPADKGGLSGPEGATAGLGGSGTPSSPPATDPTNNLGNKRINELVEENPKKAILIGLTIQWIRLSTGGPPKMVDPNADTGVIELPSLQKIEAKLMQNKRPVNPNTDPGSLGIDPTSPPSRRPGGLDPTVAYIDGELGPGGGSRIPIIGGGYTDTVPGWSPFTPQFGSK